MSYQARTVRPYLYQRRPAVVLPHDAQWCALGQLPGRLGSSSSWGVANTAIGFWITAPYDCTVYKIGWLNGSAAGGDTDVAIYDSDGTTRLVSTGATTRTGNSIYQFVDTTDQALVEGKNYFVAMNHSATTANQINAALNANVFSSAVGVFCGLKSQAVGATALPDPFVPADLSASNHRIGTIVFMLTTLGTS